MYKVEVMKRCGCFTKKGLSPVYEYASKEASQKKANELLTLMNEEFCGKHTFGLRESANTIQIVEKED